MVLWLCQTDSAIIVICGPILPKRPEKIGNNVAIPAAFFKVVLSLHGKKPAAIGFVMKNEAGNNPLSHYAMSVDDVEKMTHFDFFATLPDNVEEEVEKHFDLKYWNLQ